MRNMDMTNKPCLLAIDTSIGPCSVAVWRARGSNRASVKVQSPPKRFGS